MYRAITHDIEVTAEPFYLEDRSDPDDSHYLWAYRITIANNSDQTVTLIARHWQITDARGKVETVDGEGVVGEQPELAPSDSYQYTSGCPLTTPSGFMVGRYDMRGEDGTVFSVDIPAFSLDAPQDTPRVVN
ncbi:Co2+/Mg2+ efflux protein ApaG [Tianweitania sp. BSSL-BM11]|uniref:Protein ApaG n=1 Tax=Tianweitania aestuarii TaxID=2814886 RepID=A0ABS5RSG7_9HYPH|nr:Co2+/Mg2+ efflux protein ApaG [Tianweitania aestuarii]MBS9719267.1 Co2+/Mg2+ efflux protein ApaG [Tianweitania aestuarii]